VLAAFIHCVSALLSQVLVNSTADSCFFPLSPLLYVSIINHRVMK